MFHTILMDCIVGVILICISFRAGMLVERYIWREKCRTALRILQMQKENTEKAMQQ